MQIINDIRTAIKSPPKSIIKQRILNARIRAYWQRCEFMIWNFIGIGLLYMFNDSLLNTYINQHKYYMNISFHTVQLIACVTFFLVSLTDPGFVQFSKTGNAEKAQLIVNVLHSNASSNTDDDDDDDDDIDIHLPNTPIPALNPQNNNKYIEVHYDRVSKRKQFTIVDSVPEYNRQIIIDGGFESTWPSNYCDQCKFIRPIRSKHCFMCGRCSAKFDHHCPLVGNCVAVNNYRYFIVFLIFESITIAWSFFMSINLLFKQKESSYEHSAIGWLFRIVFFVIMFMFLFSILGLLGFHAYLLFTNQTTMEVMRPDSIDRYLNEEFKKKKQFIKKQKQNKDDKTPGYQYSYRFYGNINSYRMYFDEGFARNVRMTMKGTIKREWVTPLKCIVKKNR